MSNQAVFLNARTSPLTFTGKPAEETRRSPLAGGYQFDGRSRQWVRHEEPSDVVTEGVIASQFAA